MPIDDPSKHPPNALRSSVRTLNRVGVARWACGRPSRELLAGQIGSPRRTPGPFSAQTIR